MTKSYQQIKQELKEISFDISLDNDRLPTDKELQAIEDNETTQVQYHSDYNELEFN